MGLAGLVNAAEHKSLRALIKEAENSGEAWNANSDDSSFGAIPAGTPGKALEVDAALTTDGATHDFIVFEKDNRPIGVLFDVIREGSRRVEHLNLVCAANGKLNRCYNQIGENDASGKPIRGSAATTPLSSKDHKMSAALHHELDFWLKGMYRKTAAKPAS